MPEHNKPEHSMSEHNKPKHNKYIVVTGGVMSGLGKGITVASIGKIIKSLGFKVCPLKIDGYINIDPGTMNPYEHGEVYVLDDGSETDLDLGHYERFLNIDLDGNSNITTGKIYKEVIDKERSGKYLGKTVQVIPHITDCIIENIKKISADIVLIEVGGTIGDIENMIFLEALRQMALKEEFLFIHVSYVPKAITGEQKTKPTQHSVKQLLQMGIRPQIIVGRCSDELRDDTKKKIALLCGVEDNCVISNPDTDIYRVPLLFRQQHLDKILIEKLNMEVSKEREIAENKELDRWSSLIYGGDNLKKNREIRIGIIGKYAGLEDAYLSIKEAFRHCEMHKKCTVNLDFIESEIIESESSVSSKSNIEHLLGGLDGILVPGGFGFRGIEGKIKAIKFAREKKIPFLGICLGLQLAVIEFARNVCKINDANSSEINENSKNKVVDLLPEQKNISEKGGTMRLGKYECILDENSLAYSLYKSEKIYGRHRHRYEVNLEYKEILEKHGLRFSGKSPDKKLMEIIEIPGQFFIASQYHPEFKSRPENPEPLFMGLVEACLERL